MKNIRISCILFLFFYIVNLNFALTGAKYLIITPDNYVSTVQPLADWKTKKGIKAKIVPLSVTGSSASQIKNYITNAYNTWDIRPEYILLAGSSVPVSGNSDDYYADMTGNYRIELSVGRFPASSVNQLQNIVAKTLAFERTPYMTDSTWITKGTILIREDGSSPPDNVFWENARYISACWRNFQYTQVDTFSRLRGHNSTNAMTSINNGRMFVIYRGEAVSNWWSPFDQVNPDNLTNGNKTPIVVSGTCATMSLSSTGYQGDRFVNAGSSSSPKGSVGFFDTTSVASGSNLALNRGTVTKGFFKAIFEDRIWTMGDAAKRGKFIIDSIQPPNFISTRYTEWNLFGDPELNIWTEIPSKLTVIHDTIIHTQPQNFTVFVSRNGVPLSDAMVCLMMDTTIYLTSYTNGAGNVVFAINPLSTGNMSVTVTCHNFLPYEKNVSIQPGNLDHDVGVVSIIEPHGSISVGTGVIPKVRIKNYGNLLDSFPVTCKIGSIYDQTITTVSLLPGDTTTIAFPVWTAVGGNYIVKAYTGLSNDQWRSNDSAFGTVSVVVANDVGVDAITSPDSSHPVNVSLTPKASIKNYGSTAQVNFTATCSIVGASGLLRYSNTQTIGSLAPNESYLVNFSNWTPTISERCTVKIWTNLTGDQNTSNDQLTKLTSITMLFMTEGFNSSFPPDGWQNIAVSGSYTWQGLTSNNNPTCTPYEGNAMASYPSYMASSGSMARLISPPIALGTTPVVCSLKFFMFHDPGYQSFSDSISVEYSTDGTSFNRLASFRRYEPTSNWIEHSVYLGTLSGTIYIGFLALSQYGNNMNIDYVRMFSVAGIAEENLSSANLNLATILYAPKPNPVTNGQARISFSLAEPTRTSLKILDASGRLVKNLVDEFFGSGFYNVNWNCRDADEKPVAEGVYFYTLEIKNNRFTKKLVITR
jgi:hypothetical protein